MIDLLIQNNLFYLFGIILILPIWMYIIAKYPESRRDMIYSGVVFGIMSVIIARLYSNNDYWNPPYLLGEVYNFEDFLYGFIFGGIATEIDDVVFNVVQKKESGRPLYLWGISFILITIVSFFITTNLLGLKSIFAHIVPPLIVGSIISFKRNDLFIPSLRAGLILTNLVFLWFRLLLFIDPNLIERFWLLDNLIGIFIFKIPLEELLFAFALGFGASNAYEFGFKMRKK